MCELLIGLDDVEVLGVDDLDPGHLVVVVSPWELDLPLPGDLYAAFAAAVA